MFVFSPVFPNIVIPTVTLGRAAHQLGELLPGQLAVTNKSIHQLAEVELSSDHLEPFLELHPLQSPAMVVINQVERLSELSLIYI